MKHPESNDSTLSSRLQVAGKEHTRERHYWLNRLAGELPRSTFFPDHIQSGTKPGGQRAPDTMERTFPSELFGALDRLSKGSPVKLHMVLTAAMAALLHKHTGHHRVILGSPIYKQEQEGEFINTILPLDNHLHPRMSFKELLPQIRQTLADAVQNQAYPLAHLLQQPDMAGENAGDDDLFLFDVALLLTDIHERKYLDGIPCHFIFSFHRGDDEANPLELRVEYNGAKYERSTIGRIIDHYRELLGRMLAGPDRPLGELDSLPKDERQQLLDAFNRSGGDAPLDRTIHDIFRDRVETRADAAAVRYGDGLLSYGELNRRAGRAAWELRRRGVVPDSVVGLMEERSLEMIIGIMAILYAGGAYLPVDPKTPGERVKAMLEDSGAPVLLSSSAVMRDNSHTLLQGFQRDRAPLYRTPPRPPIKDFDGLPIPDRSLADYETYNRYIGVSFVKNCMSLQATRGCPYQCAYCHKIWPKSHVCRSAENIFEEVHLHYKMGVRRFVIVDDVFNLNVKNSSRFFHLVLKHKLDAEFYFSNGLRGDTLTEDYIDLMVEAGTVEVGFSLETASPRLQKIMGKNLNLDKLRRNTDYLCRKHPGVILILNSMHGFPGETEKEARMTLDFIKESHWLHFPYIHVVKIYHNTEMERLALESGVSPEAIDRSVGLAYHELPDTLPFAKSFTLKYQAEFFNDYVLNRERLLHVLPIQLRRLTEDEMVQKYDSYLPADIHSLDDLLGFFNISKEELAPATQKPGGLQLASENYSAPPPGLNQRLTEAFPAKPVNRDAQRVLLLDLSTHFSGDNRMLYNVMEAPLGLMYLMTYLKEQMGPRVTGKVAKSRIDFDSYDELKRLVEDFRPQVIGIRTLTFYKDFFHAVVSRLRQWGVDVPIIAGGPYATADVSLLLQDRNVDLVVMGEGEETFHELVEKIIENNGQLPAEETLRDIRGIVFPQKRQQHTHCFGREILLLDTLDELPATVSPEPPPTINRPTDLAYNIYTSGSTGRPKGVLLEHRHMTNLMWYHLHHSGLDLGRVLQFTTINFDVSIQEIFPTLLSGGNLFLIHRDMMTDIPVLFDFIERNDIKTLFLPASFLKFVLNEAEYVSLLPRGIGHIVPAGEQLIITEAFRRYLKKNGIFLHNHYGPSETHLCTVLTVDPRDTIPDLPSIGKPTLNATIHILDKQLRPLPLGVPGELYIGGLQVGRGFLNRVEMTASKYLPDPFQVFGNKTGNKKGRMYHSGDLARWQEDGTLQFLGRIDHQVKIRGFRIEMGEIENRLLELAEIKAAAVVDRVDAGGQKYLCAYIVPVDEAEAPDIDAIRERLSVHLPDYMIPAHFMRLPEIPLTFNRKVDRKALPEPGAPGSDSGGAAPRDDLEKRLAAIWGEVLQLDAASIGIDDNFFEIGGHSLNATILTGKIQKQLHIKIKLSEMFVSPTIRELAVHLKDAGTPGFSPLETVEECEYYPLSSAQKRVFIDQQMAPDSTAYNLPFTMVLHGHARADNLERVFKQLIRRHESLRTSFQGLEQGPVQRIHEAPDFAIETDTPDPEHFVRPFDLALAPLLRVGLAPLAEDRHLLMVDLHHIITDGTSIGILVKEFMALYAGETPPAPTTRYRDFTQWQHHLVETGELKKQEAYWLNRFSGKIPHLNMPTDYPRTDNRHFGGARVELSITGEGLTKCESLIQASGVTLNIFLLSIFTILLSRYTGQHDIIVGNGIAGRHHPDLHEVIGMFINMLAMRNGPHPHLTFREFLAQVSANALEAYNNQDYQFEELTIKLGLQGKGGRNPLFDFVLQTQNIHLPTLEIPDLKIEPHNGNSEGVTHFDLVVYCNRTPGGLELDFLYSTALFKESTIRDMTGFFREILEQVVNAPDITLEDIQAEPVFSRAQPRLNDQDMQFDF